MGGASLEAKPALQTARRYRLSNDPIPDQRSIPDRRDHREGHPRGRGGAPVRAADTHHSRDEAITFTVVKAKQIIDQQGDRIFT